MNRVQIVIPVREDDDPYITVASLPAKSRWFAKGEKPQLFKRGTR